MRILLLLLTALATSSPSRAQDPNISVQWHNEGAFAVHVIAPNQSSSDAGSMAMGRACDIGSEHSYPYLAVVRYNKKEESTRSLVERGGPIFQVGSDGVSRSVGYDPDTYRTIQTGIATLSVSMISAPSLVVFTNSADIIETRGCTVYSKKPSN